MEQNKLIIADCRDRVLFVLDHVQIFFQRAFTGLFEPRIKFLMSYRPTQPNEKKEQLQILYNNMMRFCNIQAQTLVAFNALGTVHSKVTKFM